MKKPLPRILLVEDLLSCTNEKELRQHFKKFGRIEKILLEKSISSTTKAYVEFNSSMEAEAAYWGLIDYQINDHTIKLCFVDGLKGKRIGDPKFRVIVRGLPPSVRWEELQAHMSPAGTILHCAIFSDDEGKYGFVDYSRVESMRQAVCKLHDTKIGKGRDKMRIIVKKYEGSSLIKMGQSATDRQSKKRPRSVSPERSNNASRKAKHHQ